MINNIKPLKNYNWWSNIDKLVLISTLLLLLFGVISMSSINQHFDGKFYFPPDLLLKKHLIFCIVGLVIIFVLSQFSLKHVIYISLFIFVLSIILCVAAILFFPETKARVRTADPITLPFCMVPWYHGAMVPWYHGAIVPLRHDTMVPWFHH